MELGLNLLMEEYRKTVTGFMKSDRLHEYAQESDERVSYLIHTYHSYEAILCLIHLIASTKAPDSQSENLTASRLVYTYSDS